MKIVVIGAGISGCIANWAMTRAGHQVRMICPSGQVGGEAGPWRLHPDSENMRMMLTEMDVYFDEIAERPHGAVMIFFNEHRAVPWRHNDSIPSFKVWEPSAALPDDLYEMQAAKIWPASDVARKAPTVFAAPEIMKPRLKHLDFETSDFFSRFEAESGILQRIDQGATGKISATFSTESGSRYSAQCEALILAAPWQIMPPNFRTKSTPTSIYRELWHASTREPETDAEHKKRLLWLANEYVLTPDLANIIRVSHSKEDNSSLKDDFQEGAWIEASLDSGPDEIEEQAAHVLGPCTVKFVKRIAGIPQGSAPGDVPQWMLAVGPHALASQLETPDSTLNRCLAFAQKLSK